MKIVLSGMHRSGINVVGRWLLRQSPLMKDALDRRHGDWVEMDDWGGHAFISQINHPEHELEWKNFSHPSNIVVTVERESYEYSNEFATKQGLNEPEWTRLYILRDFRNWLASVCKMQGNFDVSEQDLVKYQSHLIQAEEGGNYILYNVWYASKISRWLLSDVFGMEFTDEGLEYVPTNGGGSSFDKTSFDGRGSRMDVLGRWKVFRDNPDFQRLLDDNQALLERSDRLFDGYYFKH